MTVSRRKHYIRLALYALAAFALVGAMGALLLRNPGLAFWLGVGAAFFAWLGYPTGEVPVGMPRNEGDTIIPPGEQRANLTLPAQPDPARPSAPLPGEAPERRSDLQDPRENPP